MGMKEHFGLTDTAYSALQKVGVTDKDLFRTIPCFDPYGSGAKLCKLSLYYFVDRFGDWREKPFTKEKRAANAIFESLELSNKEKFQLFSYIDEFDKNKGADDVE